MQPTVLREICTRLSSGSSIAASQIKESGAYPVYGGNGLRGYTDSFNFDGECALIGRQGEQCGNVRYFAGKGYMTEHAIVLCTNENADTKYISCLLSLLNLRRLSGQSAQPGLSVDTLGDLSIDCLPYNEQVLIGKLIKLIDKKMETNTAINENLQQMVKAMFDFYFARRKPNGKLLQIVDEHEKSTVQVGDSEGVAGEYPFFTSGEAVNEWGESMVDGINCFLATGGNATINVYSGKAAYSTDTWCISGKGEYSAYLYFYLKSIIGSINTSYFAGSGLKHLQKDGLLLIDLYLPSADELEAFNKVAIPALKQSSELFRETRLLEKQRNFLLPLLMNGQATIAEN